MSEPIRVVMADDHARMRARIRDALEAGGCVVVGECASAQEAVELARQHRPDVALLDIHMPGNGITAAREIGRSLPATAVVMLTASAEDDDLFDSLRAGASGYLLKDTDPHVLVDELRHALDGEPAMSRRLVSRIMEEFRSPATPRFARRSGASSRLSAREWEVMELLGQGLSTDDVAKRLFLSPTTVRVHVSSVLRKLRVKDRAGAFRILREG
ncbi:response regulator [Nocardioides sp. Soil774]|uniref:response regulator n=1 Tax=Nocardioides sp. Soil774 TaxID=1736408 RepID=UPI000A7965AF|nr:response regulator transcription factor [Nocardioides sp. Soil774]